MYQINATRNEICDIIGEDAEHIVNTFCTLTDRVNTILYARGLNDPEKHRLGGWSIVTLEITTPKPQS